MRLLDRIFGGERIDSRAVPEKKPTPSLAQQVAEAPALFNRATRRSVGLFGRFWRWDLNVSAETRRPFVPRYLRRHDGALYRIPQNRRERKILARVVRISKQKGII